LLVLGQHHLAIPSNRQVSSHCNVLFFSLTFRLLRVFHALISFQLVEVFLVAVVLQAVAVPLLELLVLLWVRVSVRVALVHQLLSRVSQVCHILLQFCVYLNAFHL
jgi:hypothetical protein